MNTQKETPTNTAMLAGVGQGAETRQGATSNSNDNTDRPVGQAVKVSDFLRHGQEKAVPLKNLKELLHLDGRTVRLMIRAERLGGIPILADNQTGYFLPSNDSELVRCAQSMRRRAKEIVLAADAIEGAKDYLD